MATGKVVSFDEFRGFGFIAPDRGGEDVFMHVNDLESDKRLVAIDARVEFMVENGGKGLKASHVRVLDRPVAPKITIPAPPAPRPAPGPVPSTVRSPFPGPVPSPVPNPAPNPVQASAATPAPVTAASTVSPRSPVSPVSPGSPGPVASTSDGPAHDTGYCDVLSVEEFTQKVTEAMLTAVPTMTAEQILGVRECLTGLAQTHGWVDA